MNMANSSIKFDRYHKKALSCIANGENLFITGKAGTGKTTLLREIKKRFQGKKVVAVLAPTGVAAENADGYTMHSFLRLPLKPYLPQHKVLPNLYQLDEGGADVVRSIDILIIDEISMVRCDMLDATDMILRHYRNSRKPFGGVQRRKMPTEIEETTTTMNTGNYQYTVPFGGDKETLARKNGDGGSVSINHT